MNPAKQKKKKLSEVWLEAYSGVFHARCEQKWRSKCQERGAAVSGRNAQIFQIYFEGYTYTLRNFKLECLMIRIMFQKDYSRSSVENKLGWGWGVEEWGPANSVMRWFTGRHWVEEM